MINFPIDELLADSSCLDWLERHLHPAGFTCPYCGSPSRRVFRTQGRFPAYRCRACEGYYTLLTRTVFAKTRHRPATLVLLLRRGPHGGSHRQGGTRIQSVQRGDPDEPTNSWPNGGPGLGGARREDP